MNHSQPSDQNSPADQELPPTNPRRDAVLGSVSDLDLAFARVAVTDTAVAPTSRRPTLTEIRGHVARRQKSRRVIRFSGVATAAGIAALVWAIGPRTMNPNTKMQLDRIADRDVAQSSARLLAVASETPVDAAAQQTAPGHGVSLFAEISSPTPVFEIDETTNELTHLGWVNARSRVPVDVDRFHPDQQRAISNVLYQADAVTEWYPSL